MILTRKHLKLTQDDLAKKIGSYRIAVFRIENGQSPVDLDTASAIAAALGTDLSSMIDVGVSPEKGELIALIRVAPDNIIPSLRAILEPVIKAHSRSR
jgi:DNA-binding XRE family transcriptional regulator